ncbi:MAG: class I SAM-dependent methyltransferase [Acidobacteria bacterium]|nr:class I SAM-dependent methyltransferase [Acidobacteriota bacterium]
MLNTTLTTKSEAQPETHLAARAVDGVHEAALACLTSLLPPAAKVLDLGAGTGAWAAKLFAQGYPVTCVERDVSGFAFPSATCINADLNDDFSALLRQRFQAITAIEVIEHLENPRHFLRQCSALLDAEGLVLITTPNIECVAGRLQFLYSGHFRMFNRDAKFNDPTHITPIQSYLFEKMVSDTGLQILKHESTGTHPHIVNSYARLMARLLTPLVRGFKGGDSHLFVLKKA